MVIHAFNEEESKSASKPEVLGSGALYSFIWRFLMEQIRIRTKRNSRKMDSPKDMINEARSVIFEGHRPFEKRLAEYNNRISVCNFDWGEPLGKEML